MIKVPRNVDAPADLVKLAAVELAASIAHYSDPANKETAFEGYKAYKHKSVKAALSKLFNDKCAYCEMDYGGAPLDVEHFRPKSAVVELHPTTFKTVKKAPVIKPGYYWLAADWSNLLPSCIDCNRPRTQTFADEADAVSGKSNYFPLVHGTARPLDRDIDIEQQEQRLLLDPCRDDPERHLEFGRGGTIRPKSIPGGTDPKGEASIKVYGLQRDPLVRKREAIQIALRWRIYEVNRAAKTLAVDPQNVDAQRALRRVIKEIEALYLAKDKPFLAMCRQMVRQGIGAQLRAKAIAAHAEQGDVREAANQKAAQFLA
ncbi:hypothetical protein [Cupriavidus pauculus]|uniref:hypothetical protein n=1 Tax=Cupriavidus pauculus TaxID=82633 RepID=UPI001EE3466A|nr:hypothetical protein [Cupriavidus pauculus]GJG94334.1 hypothetical protein CBA19C6_07615 [Cupriavidus pauculus]